MTYPKALIEEAVNNWICKAACHCQPMTRIVQSDEKPLVFSRLNMVQQTWIQVQYQIKKVKRKPAQGKDNHKSN